MSNNIEVITLSSSDEEIQSKKDTARKCKQKKNTDSQLIDSATSKVESSPQKFTARKSLTNMLADDIRNHISVSQIATKLFPKFTARKSLVNGSNSSKKRKNHVSVSQSRQNNAGKSLTSNSSKHVQNCKSISKSNDLCTTKYDASIPVTSTPKPNKPEKTVSGSLLTFQSQKLSSENSEVPAKDICMKAKHTIKQTLNPIARNHNTEVNSVQDAAGVKMSAVSQKELCASAQALRTVVGEEAKSLQKTMHSLSIVNSVPSKKKGETEIKESAQSTVVLNGKQTSLTHSKKHAIPKSLKNDLTSRGVSIFNAVQKTQIELPSTSNFKSSEPDTEAPNTKRHETLQGISNLEKSGLSIQLINNKSASSRKSSNFNHSEQINDKSSALDSKNDAKSSHKKFKSSASISGTDVKANSLNNKHSKTLTFKDPKECQALLSKVNQKDCHKKKRSFRFEGLLITPVSKGKNNSSNHKIPESYQKLPFPSKRKSDLENANAKSKKGSIKILSVESLVGKANSFLGNTDCKEPEFSVDLNKAVLSPAEIINVNKVAEISAANNKHTLPASDLSQLNSEENDKSKVLPDMYDSNNFSSSETRVLAETSSKSNFTISSKKSLNCVASKDSDAEEMKSFATKTKEDGTKDLHVKETLSINALLARFESSNVTCKVVNKNLNDQGIQKNLCTDAQKDELAVSEDIQEAKAAEVGTVTLVKENSSKGVRVEDSSLLEALNAVDRVIAIDEIKSSHSEGQRSSFKAIPTELSLKQKKSSSALDVEDDPKLTNPATSTKLSLKRKRSTSDGEDDPKKCVTNPNSVFCNGKLVVEQKKKEPTENSYKFPVDNKEKFIKLLEFCKPYMKLTEDEEKKIQNNLLKHLNYAHQNFVNSNEFSDLITLTKENIIKDSNKVFVHLNYLQLELKARKQKKNIEKDTADHKSAVEAIKINASNQNSSNVSLDQYGNKISSSTSNHFTEVGQNLQKNPIIESEKPDSSTTKEIFIEPSTSKQDCSRNISSVPEISNLQADTSKEQKSNKSDSKNTKLDADARQELQVKRLERLLRHLDKKIRKLQTKELSLEDLDDEDSAYIMEDKYKQKFNKVWNELCKLKQRSRRTGREMEKTFTYEGSRYTCLNHAVEKMINKRKPAEKFPNYIEIYKLVKNINDTQFLGLDEPSVAKLAKKVFQDVVLELKARRERDDEQVLGCYLTDNIDLANDPAEHDEALKEKLSLSIAAGEKRIAEIIDKYAEKQPEASEMESDNEHSEKEPNVSKKIETVISDLNIKKVDVGTDLPKMHAEVRLSEGNKIENNHQEATKLIKSSDLPDTDPNSSGSDEFPDLKKQGIVCKEMVYISSDASTEPECNSEDLKCSPDLKRDSIQNFKSALNEKLKHSKEAMQTVKDLKSALSEKLKHAKETMQPLVINDESDSSSDLPSPDQILQSS